MEEVIKIIEEWKTEIAAMSRQINSLNPKSFDNLKRKKVLMTADEDMARVNPHIAYSDKFRINCAYCTATYDLRRRGYDVEADDYPDNKELEPNIFQIYSWWTHYELTRSNTSVRQSALDILYPGYKFIDFNEFSINEIQNRIIKEGNSRGQISFMWKTGKAHSVIYEVSYGKLILRDCQHNRKVSFKEFAEQSSRIYYFRIDNQEPTIKILNCVKNKNIDTVYFTDKNALLEKFKKKGFQACMNKNRIKVNLKNRNDLYLLIDEDGKITVKNILNDFRGGV